MEILHRLRRTNRSEKLLLIIGVMMALFVVRLFYIQVIRHSYYVEQARQTQVSKFTIQPQRGKIYAMDGNNKTVPLVLNETVFTAYADPQEMDNKDAVVAAMKKVAGGNLVDGFEDRLSSKTLRYVPMARQITPDQATLLKKDNLAGVGFQQGTRRVYPEGNLAAQLLGYVNTQGEGQYGLEQFDDTKLKGTPGLLQAVTDVRQVPLTIGSDDISIPAKDGDNLALTIDRNIQVQAETLLKSGLDKAGATHGSIVVMDPSSGAVLAMANDPTYDPSKYSDVTDYNVFQNTVVSVPYEAGSVIKTLTVGSGIDSGAVTASSTYNNTGSVSVDGIKISNVEEDPIFPNTTLTDVLEYSLNTGVVYVLQQMGGGQVNEAARQKLYSYFAGHFRFGQKTGIEQANESPGVIIGPNDADGPNIRYANMAFGQGMDVTILQVASAFSAEINGGTYNQPHLINGTINSDGTIAKETYKPLGTNVVFASTSESMRNIIWQARKKGFFGNVDPAGYKVGGKTGTSQIIDPVTKAYTNASSIGSYLGFGGVDTPRYVIMVKVEDSKLPGYAGTVAAGPIFNDMSNWMLQYLRLQPAH